MTGQVQHDGDQGAGSAPGRAVLLPGSLLLAKAQWHPYAWTVADTGVLLLSVRAVLRRRHARHSYRFPVQLAAEIVDDSGATFAGVTTNLSRYGASVKTAGAALVKDRVTLRLALPDGQLAVPATVIRGRARPNAEGDIGLQLDELPPRSAERLVTFLFVTLPRQAGPLLPIAEQPLPQAA